MKTLAKPTIVALAAAALFQVACGPSLYRKKPASPVVNDAITAMWSKDIKEHAQSGDWILTRSYSAIGDVIAIGSGGEEISHAVIYDAERGTVIEAITPKVREVPLEELLARNRIAIVVRPNGTTHASRRASVARARGAVGSKFDYTGLFGISSGSKFYCSELVVWASGVERGDFVVTPASLLKRGEVLYLSGVRDDALVQRTALALGQSDDSQCARRPSSLGAAFARFECASVSCCGKGGVRTCAGRGQQSSTPRQPGGWLSLAWHTRFRLRSSRQHRYSRR